MRVDEVVIRNAGLFKNLDDETVGITPISGNCSFGGLQIRTQYIIFNTVDIVPGLFGICPLHLSVQIVTK